MLLHPSSRVRSRRPAFTLVEMLVVLGIIGILIALILPAIMGAQYRARVAAINMEIKQLESALETYKQQKGEYPPSFGEGDYTNTAIQNSSIVERHLQRCYPKITRPANRNNFYNNIVAPNLNPSNALVFWLGATAASVTDPFQGSQKYPHALTTADLTRNGFYEFDAKRLTNGPFPSFQPRNCRDTSYIYFESRTYDRHWTPATAALGVAQPYYQDDPLPRPPGTPPPAKPVNPSKFQIICAGLDGDFGATGNYASDVPYDGPFTKKRFPGGVAYGAGDRDNLTNFSDGRTLGDARPQ